MLSTATVEVVVDRHAGQEANELARFGSIDFIAGKQIGEHVEDDEARLDAFDDGLEPTKYGRSGDDAWLAGCGENRVFASKRD
jgi:hypothetical protein